MDAAPPTSIEYASGGTGRRWRWRRWQILFVVGLGLYAGSYLVLREFVEPAVNMRYFVYPGPATADECCYYGFWPPYKADHFLTGRRHNLDRTCVSPADAGP